MKLLHIDSSILGQNSVSRTLTAEVVEQQRRLHPGLEVVYRDLAAVPHLHFSPCSIIAAAYGVTPDSRDSRTISPMAMRWSTSCSPPTSL